MVLCVLLSNYSDICHNGPFGIFCGYLNLKVENLEWVVIEVSNPMDLMPNNCLWVDFFGAYYLIWYALFKLLSLRDLILENSNLKEFVFEVLLLIN